MKKLKLTANGSTLQERSRVAIYGWAGLLFVGWIINALFSSTKLVSGEPVFWSLPIVATCVLIGAALGYALSTGKWRPSSVAFKKAGTVVFIFVFALWYGIIGDSLAERATGTILFWGHNVETRTFVQPVTAVGIGRGATRYVELAGFGPIRFEISRLDFKVLAASGREPAFSRYCLPVVTERVGKAVRVRLPDVPRPIMSERSGAIVKCQSVLSPPTLYS